ncbi:MAG TPA: FTR1 family protein [Candidatus Acidoferrales bacterium]|nr:FTR1 family protein [Candidatus Acidoferrales bacterium]
MPDPYGTVKKNRVMFTTAVLAFREFFEAFLIIGIFLGCSQKLKLKKEKEIIIASIVGIVFAIGLATGTYLLADHEHNFFTEKNADSFESYLLIFSGFFIAYVALSLHKSLSKHSKSLIDKAHQKMEKNIFDVSLFLTIVFMIIREGFELALFTAATSLFSTFMQNMLGLFIGFLLSSVFGVMIFLAYVKFSIGKIFRITEYVIILLGASLIQNGITMLFATRFAINLSKLLPIPLVFLPNEDSLLGHLLQSFLGVDRNFSVARLLIMAIYITLIYLYYLRQQAPKENVKTAKARYFKQNSKNITS